MRKLALLALLFIFLAGSAGSQSVEILYTKSAMSEALALKKTLNAEHVSSFSALGLHNVSGVRKDAYLKKISSKTAVIILGEAGAKATQTVDFPMPVIIEDALDPTAATGLVVRVLSTEYATGKSIPDQKIVSSSNDVSLAFASLNSSSEVVFVSQGIENVDVVNQVLAEIYKKR